MPDSARAEIVASPVFGRHLTDHMASATWTVRKGWRDRKVGPLEPFTLHPGTAVLHYGQEIFEGLKAYRHADGGVFLFRPEVNARRFAHSARRMALPPLPEEDFLASIEALVRADEQWVPLRRRRRQEPLLTPFMFAADEFTALRVPERAVYSVIAWPAGPLFPSGHNGVTLWISSRYTRSAPGGTGDAKCGGNYAASMAAQIEATEHGCDQVLYLDRTGGEGNLEEAGTMNVFLVTGDGLLVTPALGAILDGVTRDAVLSLAAEFGLTRSVGASRQADDGAARAPSKHPVRSGGGPLRLDAAGGVSARRFSSESKRRGRSNSTTVPQP